MKQFITMSFLFFTLLLSNQVFSQYCPFLGPDQFLPCGVGSTTLTADLSQCGPGGPNPNQTTNYGVTNIPYVAQTNTGTQLFMTDDSQQGPFNIGFNFCFFGTTYTQFYVGSNGWISFSGGQPTTFTTQTIPTGNALVPKNCIMGPWQDWHPGLGGQIRYQMSGVAPCRKLTVSWIGVPMFSCTGNQGTFHIVIYESTNVIENYIQNKPACLQWQNGTATQGLHNLAGTIGIAVPGRNSSAWVANNDAWRWTPSGPVVTPTLTWYQVGNPNPIGTGPTITVTPPAAGANYTCHFVYPICNAGWSTCNAFAGLGPDTVFVQPGPPQLPTPTVTFQDPTCNNYCDGLINVTPNGGTGQINITWNNQPPLFNLTNLCSGVYSYNLVDAAGCTYNSSVTLNNPPPIIINPIVGSDTVCFNSTNNVYTVSSLTPNLGYIWTSTIGNISSGQGTTQIDLDVTGVAGGVYNNTLSVIGVSQIGCQSNTENFTIVDLNILPVIDPIGPFCDYDNCVTLSATPPNGTFIGSSNLSLNQYCPDGGFIGVDTVEYIYTQSGCVFDTSLTLQVFPRPIITPVIDGLVGDYSEYHEICEGDSIVDLYSAESPNAGYNEWYAFGDTIQSPSIYLTWDSEGIYTFDVVRWDNGCVSYPATITVSLSLCPRELIYIPNAFTPDGNEFNQYFAPVITSGVDVYDYEMLIFNKWGEIIWESHDVEGKWDGTYNGQMCQQGVYIWKITFGVPQNDERKQYFGSVTILK
jgi:gliding motility-associated-like protein